jgi:hypothetical protein
MANRKLAAKEGGSVPRNAPAVSAQSPERRLHRTNPAVEAG